MGVSKSLGRLRGWSALDVSPAAVDYAAANYRRSNLAFIQASVTAIPISGKSLDLIVAYELIEHLPEWQLLLEECRRLLAPGGQLIISTPNKFYYAEHRKLTGPNPFHVHEFEFDEFREELKKFFPHVSLYTQNHAQGIVFSAVARESPSLAPSAPITDIRLETGGSDIETAHFYLAVCALSPQTGSPTFIHIPKTSNVLREREQHIELLEGELAQKDKWLADARAEHERLLELFARQQDELDARRVWAEKMNQELDEGRAIIEKLNREIEQRNLWAETLNQELEHSRATIERLNSELEQRAEWASQLNTRMVEAGRRIVELQEELAAEQSKAGAAIAALEKENLAKTTWAENLNTQLAATEQELQERTRWAQDLDRQRAELLEQLDLVKSSRWVKLGRKLNVGPNLEGK